jgi:hypothetical protein
MRLHIGDKVREGMHVGTVTDVGTVLIQLKTTEGALRVACPWDLVKVQPAHTGSVCFSRVNEIKT